VSVVEKYKHINSIIGDQAVELLFEFPNQNYVSSYGAYTSLKKGYPTMDYKNTHKRVKRLESLEFIEPVKAKEVKVEDVRNRAKYYRISEAGMFYLFYREEKGVSDLLPSIINAHGNYLIFETLLYPYFKKETLAEFHNALELVEDDLGDIVAHVFKGPVVEILDKICRYIGYCCHAISNYIAILKAHMPNLKNQEKKALRDRQLKELLDGTTLEKDHLVMEIVLWFRSYKKTKYNDLVFLALAQDDKFVKIAQDLHKDYDRSFEIVRKIREGTHPQ
jgi:hypothetical protein